MKTFRHFLWYLAKLFLEWEMFKIKVVEKMKTNILSSITFFRKSHRLWDNVEKCGRDPGATNDVIIWRIRVACWICKAICTYAHAHTDQYVILIAFPLQQWIRERSSMLRYTYIVCLVISIPVAYSLYSWTWNLNYLWHATLLHWRLDSAGLANFNPLVGHVIRKDSA